MKASIKFVLVLLVILLWNNNQAIAQLEFFEEKFIPHNLNYDGTVVIGTNFQEHLVWRKTEGFKAIGGAIPVPYYGRASVSEDGMVIGGSIESGNSSEMAIYKVSDGTWKSTNIIANTTSRENFVDGYRISGDGSKLVGVKGFQYYKTRAITFDTAGNVFYLPYPESDEGSRANVVSRDGNVIGGCRITGDFVREGAYWVNNTYYPLLDENNRPSGEVMAVSADGSTLFGYGYGDNKDIYKYDISTHSFEVLCSTDVNNVSPILIDMSDDGKVGIVVYYDYTNADLSQVYIYVDKDNGEDVYMNINDYLDTIGIDRQGVNVNRVVAVSGNGQVLVGIDGQDTYTAESFIINMGNIVSTNENADENKSWAVFPNPATDMINLNLPNNYEKFIIKDIHGNLIKKYNKETCPTILDISDLNKGMYLLQVKTKQKDMFNKLVKY